ncbi:MAG: TAXI family TRAP transporter solute-binding subunit [Proteobacteria bacterium]|nr:TAXI family TRAP transporter solute-binding subunit [Pseudomonadota bacterium]
MRRRTFLAGAAALPMAAVPPVARAQQDVTFFRILTGGTVGTYFPIGGLIANAISNPPGSRPCAEGGSCGVPGLVATSVTSNGSVSNVAAIAAGSAQSGFVQSDIAYWAYNGTGIYSGRPKVEVLRAIANLYPESIQLVVRKGSGIKSVPDLRGRKISLDEPGSGTLVDARLILQAFGLSEKDLQAQYFPAQRVADNLRDGTIDGFFSVSGWPQSSVADLAATVGIELVPIAGPEVDKLIDQFSFFSKEEIPDNAYKGVAGVPTVSVHAIWATSSKQSDELIYKVTAALWNPATRRLLDSGHAKGREIRLETATRGLGIPLHPGAERFYKEQGLIR